MQPYHQDYDRMIEQHEPSNELEIIFIDSSLLALIDYDCTFGLHPVSLLIIDDLPF